MLSTVDLERLIAVKRREIEKEKTRLGLASSRSDEEKDNATASATRRHVSEGKREQDAVEEEGENEDVPPDLERYIRRYLGLPVMLKAGEYSPNNPLTRGERPAGGAGALLGLGEYERRRDTLRKLRQQQYREYLDQQAKKKQEEKEQAERARREREQREREQEERERERERIERERASPERPRAYTNTAFNSAQSFTSKVDTGVQTVAAGRSLSVAVQTDERELYRLSPTSPKWLVTQAERELSPRTVQDSNPRPRRSCGEFQQESRSPPARALFDADAIQLRNARAEQEAADKRQSYRRELKNQIQEQQRIREEREAREKMLEQAETRRLEEQLRALRAARAGGAGGAARAGERGRQGQLADKMRENATDYEKKRTALQKEIDEQQALLRLPARAPRTSLSDSLPSKLPLYHPPKLPKSKQTFSTNIPDKSIFSPNYDVDSYLRKNLNPSKESLFNNRLHTASSELSLSSKYLTAKFPIDDRKNKDGNFKIKSYTDDKETGYDYNYMKTRYNNNDDASNGDRRVVVEKAIIHDRPKERKYEPSKRSDNDNPIPVLRHSPIVAKVVEDEDLSDAMKVVDDKWKVPVVQKNILKSLPNEEGKNVNILTQLGSIRRQLQLEQLKLDKMLNKDDV